MCAEAFMVLQALDDHSLTNEEAALFMLAEVEDKIAHRLRDAYVKYHRFHLDRFTDEECKDYFRFKKDDLQRLATALQLDEEYCHKTGICWEQLEGLCVLLRRLAYPNR